MPPSVLFLTLMTGTLAGGAGAAVFTVRNETLHVEGMTVSPEALARPVDLIEGPHPEITGISAGDPTTISGRMDVPLDGRGSLTFWFHTAQHYRSGVATEYEEQTLVEIPGVLTVCFIAEPSSINLYIGWGERRNVATRGASGIRTGIQFDRVIRVLLPEWPGPEWHHMAIHWDSATGESNAFVNGTPFHIRGSRIAPWMSPVGRELKVTLNPRLALADVRVSPAMVDESSLPTLVGSAHFRRLDALLGVEDHGELDVSPLRGRLLYSRDLAGIDEVSDWVLEGPGQVTFRDGWMEIRSTRPDGPNGHVVYWPKHDWPDQILVEFEFEILSPAGLNILFFAATGRDGLDLFHPNLKPRDGTFIDYTHGDINSYHISYFANMPNEPRAVANLRKNSGFYLLANGPVGLARGGRGAVQHAALVKDGGRIRMAVDGKVLIDFVDDGKRAGPVWSAGKIGFRQMQWTAARYRNLRISTIKMGD